MSAGGFIFEKANLAYDANTNGVTIRDWALAVHKARCQAFLDAATREQQNGGQGWYSLETMINDEMSEYVGGSYYSGNVYIHDIHPLSVDVNGEFPAFVSFMKANNSGAEYCIITARNYHCNPNYSDRLSQYSEGLYMNSENLCKNGSSYEFGQSMGHAFALNGFGSYDVTNSNFCSYGCTKIIGSYRFKSWSNNYTNNYDNASLIYRRVSSQTSSYLVGKTYSFGYAIKGEQIETFYRRTDAAIWLWSVIGNILDTLIADNDTSRVCAITVPFQQNNSETEFNYTVFDHNNSPISTYVSFTNSSGLPYTPSISYINCDITRTYNGCSATRTSNSAPSDVRYNAIAVFASLTGEITSSDPGIDGSGNGGKGFVSTDVLRMVSSSACPTSGVTFQGGNFVSIKAGLSGGIGFILGWDNSNESII